MAFAGGNHCIKEFRIVLPLDVEEYHVGQLYSVAEASKNETGGGDGVEVVVNEPFDEDLGVQPEKALIGNGQKFVKGQYTHKIYHLTQKVPSFIRILAPKGSLEIHEKAWNAYPYCRTVVSNPDYMKDAFYIVIESFHVADDIGECENVHGLQGRDLDKRIVVKMDIANDKVSSKDYKAEWDPTKVDAPKAGRSALPLDKTGEWKKEVKPVMCCYKVVKVMFKWWGLQKRVENFIMTQEQRLFLNFHRQVVCWLDKYHNLTMEDIRRIEDETKCALEKQRLEGPVRGMTAKED